MKNVLVTGGTGYIGTMLIEKLSQEKESLGIQSIINAAITPPTIPNDKVIYEKLDVRDNNIAELFKKYHIDCVVHLASIVTPGKKSNRDFEYSVDVVGTQNVLKACIEAKVKRIIISSSGAAYGYHPENINVLTENSPIRGNYEFAYSYHKRLVEEELAKYRTSHPELEQTIFRIGTVMGKNMNNQISDIFKKPFLIGILGSETPFNFILDEDVAKCFMQAIVSPKTGIFNLAGDGYLTISDYSRLLNKPKILIPSLLLKYLLKILKVLGLTQYGPEQVMFLQYRPVLDNTKLKKEFGFIPQMTSLEVFKFFMKHNLKFGVNTN
jgi:UDP-glucose 4-epimerase